MYNVYFKHEDENEDGISEHVKVYSDDFGNDPLFGDYRGVELAKIHYIPSRPESVMRAEEIAMAIIKHEVANGAKFDRSKRNEAFSYFSV